MSAVPDTCRQDTLRVTCVVVSYHRESALQRVLERLSHPLIDIVVVNVEDNPRISVLSSGHQVVRLAGNPGYAAAVNAGVAVASTDYVVFLNDDAVMDADAVLELARPILAGDADVTVPLVLDPDGHVERTIAAIPTPSTLALEWMLLPDRPLEILDSWAVEKWRLPTVPERIDAAAAVAVAARRCTLERIPLPEQYFLYWEESEWFWRLRELGQVVQYRPDVVCRHDGGRDDVRPQKSSLLARNAVRCVRRTQGRSAATLALMIVVTWNLRLVVTDVARCVAAGLTRRDRVRARLAGLTAAIGSWRELR